MKKWFFIIVSVLVLLFALLIALSPYGNHDPFPYKLVSQSVVIATPVSKVFAFLGNSGNAARWSVFVHHITTLNPEQFADGLSGSIRRCFCRQDETGTQWDEMITENIRNKKRQLTIFHLADFLITANHLATEQLYNSISENRCRLTFTVFFKDEAPALAGKIKMYMAAYKIKSVLTRNMANIKRITEHE